MADGKSLSTPPLTCPSLMVYPKKEVILLLGIGFCHCCQGTPVHWLWGPVRSCKTETNGERGLKTARGNRPKQLSLPSDGGLSIIMATAWGADFHLNTRLSINYKPYQGHRRAGAIFRILTLPVPDSRLKYKHIYLPWSFSLLQGRPPIRPSFRGLWQCSQAMEVGAVTPLCSFLLQLAAIFQKATYVLSWSPSFYYCVWGTPPYHVALVATPDCLQSYKVVHICILWKPNPQAATFNHHEFKAWDSQGDSDKSWHTLNYQEELLKRGCWNNHKIWETNRDRARLDEKVHLLRHWERWLFDLRHRN